MSQFFDAEANVFIINSNWYGYSKRAGYLNRFSYLIVTADTYTSTRDLLHFFFFLPNAMIRKDFFPCSFRDSVSSLHSAREPPSLRPRLKRRNKYISLFIKRQSNVIFSLTSVALGRRSGINEIAWVIRLNHSGQRGSAGKSLKSTK